MPNPTTATNPVMEDQNSKPNNPEPQMDSSGTESSLQEKEAEIAIPAPNPPPETIDGGTVAWMVVLGAWCTSFCSYGWLNSVGIFQEYYQDKLLTGYSASVVAWIPSLEIFFMSFMGPIVGTIFDHFGPRWLLLVGTFLHVFGLFMASLGTEYYQLLLAQGICSGLGISLTFIPSVNCVVGWFQKKRGMAFGILFTGSSIGGIVFPIMVTRLINGVGFPWAMRTSAFVILLLLTIANITIRPIRTPQARKKVLLDYIKPLKEREFLFITLGFFFYTFGYFVPINYLVVQATEAGLDARVIPYLVPILNAASLFGRVSSGFMADKLGVYTVFVIVSYLTGTWVLALWIPATTLPITLAFAILFGFFSGGYVSLITPLIMEVSPLSEIGYRTGIVYLTSAVGSLTTNPISGAMLASPGGWIGPKVFSGMCCIIGTALVHTARLTRKSSKSKMAV